MAPGVAKSFCKQIRNILDIRYPEYISDSDTNTPEGKLTNYGVYKELKAYRKRHRLIMDKRGLDYVRYIIRDKYSKEISNKDIELIIDMAIKAVDSDTHQAMEAVIHNLNSMHCLPYSEKIWVYDTKTNKFTGMEIGKLAENFESNRFMVVSINKNSGKAEFKYVTAAKKMDNKRNIVKIINNQGATVNVTDNHKVMTIEGREITEKYPEDLAFSISPRGIHTPMVNMDICLEDYGRVRVDSPYLENHIIVTEEFAELMGYYVADGSLMGDTGTLCFTTCGKVSFKELKELVYIVFGKDFSTHTTTFNHSVNGESEKDIRFGVGRRLTRMIADKFGKGSHNKKIPIEIMFATDNIKEAFLKAYFRCDGRKNASYGEASSVSEELIHQIAFMMYSLKASPHFNCRVITGGFNSKSRNIHTISISAEDAVRVGTRNINNTAFSIPKYDLSMIPNKISNRKSGNVRYSELEEMLAYGINIEYQHFENFFVNKVVSKEVYNSGEEYVYDISVEDNENFMTLEGIYVHNSRAGEVTACPNYGKPWVMAV